MTLDESEAANPPDQAAPPASLAVPAPTPAQTALERYGRRMRRSRMIYVAVIAVVVLALGVIVGVVWSRGESAHTTLRTAAHAAPSVPLQAPSASPALAWQSPDRTAIGTPYWGGTVVTYTADSVRGRNAVTGALMWSYTRSDRAVCQAIQSQGITIAIFQVNGNCDQVTALDTGTGARKWTRTLAKDTQLLDGHPSYGLTQFAVMLSTGSVIYAIDPASGLDRWVYHPDGCTINGAVIGAQGALISQTCARPKCAGLTFCGPGPQLLLRDASAGRSDSDKDKANPDQIKWNLIGTSAVPASADQVISALDPTAGQLRVFDQAKGKILATLPLTGPVPATPSVEALATAGAELIWISGVTYAVRFLAAGLLWSAPTSTLPTVTPTAGTTGGIPDLTASSIAVGDATGIALLDPLTGLSMRDFGLASPPAAGSRVYPFGTGFLVVGPSTVLYR